MATQQTILQVQRDTDEMGNDARGTVKQQALSPKPAIEVVTTAGAA